MGGGCRRCATRLPLSLRWWPPCAQGYCHTGRRMASCRRRRARNTGANGTPSRGRTSRPKPLRRPPPSFRNAGWRSPMRVNVPVVPASSFGMVIGLAGLGTAWRWAHQVWGLPAIVGEAIIWLSIAVWAGFTILYVAKWSVARDEANGEVADPVQCCFVGLIGVATMLVAGGIQPYSPALAVILFTAGAAFAFGFAVWRTGGLWQGEREHAATTPVLYLPTVARSFVTAITAAALAYADWGQGIFGGGLFSWLAIESLLLGRMLTGPELPPPL